MIIAVDAMGGDGGPAVTVPAVVAFVHRHPDVRVLLHGDARELPNISSCGERLRVIDCPQRLDPGERPGQALRHKRQSSLWRSLEAVADGGASACVTGGETGSLMAMGMAVVGVLPGITRPAICTLLPRATGGMAAKDDEPSTDAVLETGPALETDSLSETGSASKDVPPPAASGHVGLLDMGANVDCAPELLHQFARMGVARLQAEGVAQPRVALLNIGIEGGKGNRAVKAAAELLEADRGILYIGFIEADQILSGGADLVVCDGFVGNVALKAIEGVARVLMARLRQQAGVSGGWGGLQQPLLDSALNFLDPAQYNGASLLGLRGVVVKSHGAADAVGFGHALEAALIEARGQLPARIAARLAAASGHPPLDAG